MGKKVMAWILAALVLFTSMPVEAAIDPEYGEETAYDTTMYDESAIEEDSTKIEGSESVVLSQADGDSDSMESSMDAGEVSAFSLTSEEHSCSWSEGVITAVETDSQNGEITFTCQDCGDAYSLEFKTDNGKVSIKEFLNSQEGVHELVIPAEINGCPVTSLGDGSFAHYDSDYNNSIKSIVLPDSLEEIGVYAFLRQTELESVVIPSSATNIKEGAFLGCSKLKDVTLPEGLITIGNGVFDDCDSLKELTIPSTVKSIPSLILDRLNIVDLDWFYENAIKMTLVLNVKSLYAAGQEITSLTLPDSITSLPSLCFSNAAYLKSITIPGTVKTIHTGAFSGCSALETVILEEGIQTIERYAFSRCPSLKEITIPSSVNTLEGHSHFTNCNSLEKAVINCTAVAPEMFVSCAALKEVVLADTVTEIGEKAFCNTPLLTEIVVPESVNSIGDKALGYHYGSNEKVSEFTIFGKLGSAAETYANENGFIFKEIVPEIHLEDYGSDIYHKRYTSDGAIKEKEEHSYVDHVCACGNTDYILTGQINDLTFDLYKSGELVINGVGALSLPDQKSSMPWSDYNNFVKQVTLGQGITAITAKSLSNLVQVKTISIPSSVVKIDATAFDGCAQLASFTVDAGNETYCVDENGVVYSKDKSEIVRVPNAWTGNLSVPSTVTTIKAGAFSTCHSFTGLTYDNACNLKVIEDRAFQGCRSLQSFTFPKSLMQLGGYIFSSDVMDNKDVVLAITNYYGIDTGSVIWTPLGMKVGENQPQIEYEEGFVPEEKELVPWNIKNSQSDHLLSVRFESEDKVPSISTFAFTNTRNVITAYYLLENEAWEPDMHDSYGGSLVWRGYSYAELVASGIEKESEWNLYSNGILYIWGTGSYGAGAISFYSSTDSIPWNSYNAMISRIVIENGISSIGKNAFTQINQNLTKVKLPNTVEYIYDYAFSKCTKLAEIQIGTRSRLVAIKSCAFRNCSSLKSFYFPEGLSVIEGDIFAECVSLEQAIMDECALTSLPVGAFYGCSSLTDVQLPKNLTRIENQCFKGCTSLKGLHLPASLKTIDYLGSIYSPFYNCTSLEYFSIEANNEDYSVCNDMLYDKEGKVLYICPNGKKDSVEIPSKTVAISAYAFANCQYIKEVVVPDSVVVINGYAFSNCNSLEAVRFGNDSKLISIGEYAYEKCNSLSSMSLPDRVSSIGDYAFGCLQYDWIGNHYGVISHIFDSISVPNTVAEIGNEAFSCVSAIDYRGSACQWEELNYSHSNVFTAAPHVFGEGKVTVEEKDGNFGVYTISCEECGIAQIEIEFVTDNGKAAIISYSGPQAGLDELIVPAQIAGCEVTLIRPYCFENASFRKIKLPETITEIGEGTFKDCKHLEAIDIPNQVANIRDKLFYGCSNLTEVLFPKNMKSIGSESFYGCTQLGNIILSEGVHTIGRNAFMGTTIDNITLPGSVKSVGESAFADSTITSVTITDLGAWCAIDFSDASSNPLTFAEHMIIDGQSVEEITLPEDVINIKSYAFYGAKFLKGITFSNNVQSIQRYAFAKSGLKNLDIPQSITMIDYYTFKDCTSLETVNWGGDHYIRFNVFDGCTSLKSVNIPDTVWSCNDYAFYNCPSLKEVEIGENTGVSTKALGYYYSKLYGNEQKVDGFKIIGQPDSDAQRYANENGFNFSEPYHEWDEGTVVIEPTCEAGGQILYHCILCDKTRYADMDPLDGHDYDDPIIIQEPSCSGNGIALYICKRCGSQFEENIDPKGHTYGSAVREDEQQATCINSGWYYNAFYCTDCGELITRKYVTLSPLGHDYDFTTHDASCTESGWIVYRCKRGDHSYWDYYQAASGHSYTDTVHAPNCAGQGYTEHACITCGYSYRDNYTDALEHVYVESIIAPATCTADGLMKYTCECKDSYTAVIPAIGHNFGKGVVVAPTCTGMGYTEYTCGECGFVYRNAYTRELGHSYRTTIIEPATCERNGLVKYTCDCNASYTTMIPAVGHTFGEGVVVEPTCGSMGYTRYSCSTCKYTYANNYVHATEMHTARAAVYEKCLDETSGSNVIDMVIYCMECDAEMYRETMTQLASPVISLTGTTSGVEVKWDAVGGAEKYRVFYRVTGGTWTAAADVTETSYVVTGLTNGINYSFLVRCLSEDGKTYTSAYDVSKSKSITYSVNLAAPEISSLTNTASGVEVKWGAVSGAEKYRLFYRAAGEAWKAVADVNGTSYVVTGLSNEITYSFFVRCLSADGKNYISAYDVSKSKSITYSMNLASPVISSLTNTASGVEVKWGAVSGAAKYRVFYRATGEAWKTAAEVTGTSYVVTGLTSGTTYSFLVRCLSADGKTYTSAYDVSKSKSITSVALASPVISSLSSTATGVQVSWGAVSGAAQYRVFYKTATGAWAAFGNTTGTSMVVTGLTSGTTYSFLVRSLSADGKSYTDTYDAAKNKSLTYIAQPGVSSVTNTSTGVQVKWNAVPGAAQYRVFYKAAGGAWTGYNNTTGTSMVVTGLTKGTTYSFTVRCVSADGKSYTSTYDTTGKSIKVE